MIVHVKLTHSVLLGHKFKVLSYDKTGSIQEEWPLSLEQNIVWELLNDKIGRVIGF